jgi:Protein of unknwon function (DUF3008)
VDPGELGVTAPRDEVRTFVARPQHRPLSRKPKSNRQVIQELSASAFWKSHLEKELDMPAKSAAQQKAAGTALAAKRGETSPSSLKGAAKEMYSSMSEQELEEFASTKRKGKPEHVSKERS